MSKLTTARNGIYCTFVAGFFSFCIVLPAAQAQSTAKGQSGAKEQIQLKALINPGDQGEQSRFGVFSAWKGVVEQALRKEKITGAAVTLSMDATGDLGATRSRIPDIFVAPAHVIGSAVRYGYTPVLGLENPIQAVLIVAKDSPISNLSQMQNKNIGMPMQDSIVTYLVRGEVHAANTTIKRHFKAVYDTRYQDALLPCLRLRRCDVVAVERAVYDRWLAAGEQLKVVMETKEVPALSIAVKNGSRPSADALRAALAEYSGAVPGSEGVKFSALTAEDFAYVSTLGYFTPRALPGATLVDATAVDQMLQGGGVFIDTRTEAEFKAGRVPGAVLVPYVEKSHKEPDFNATADSFDLSKLPPSKNTVIVFACNGAECWKSFKASHAAVKAGYSKVHWFRGGLPEWRAAGLKVDSGS